MILQCEGCGTAGDAVRDLGFKLCPPCNEKMSQAFDAKTESETKTCPKCGQQMILQDEGNYSELNTTWFECECGHFE